MDTASESITKKILVVEDEVFLRDLYLEILTDAGFTVDTASDGEEAFTKMKQGGYDLVLLDIMLPKKDGIQILKELKVVPPISPNKAILILTNLGQETVISEGIALGVRGYLVKSDYTPDQLITEVRRVLATTV